MAVAAIFDIDGTLVSFKFDVEGTRRALLAELRALGADTSGLNPSTPTQQILDAAKARLPPGDGAGYEGYRRTAFSILDHFELENITLSAPLPGVREALLDLRSKRVRLAVLTNSGRKAAYASLGRTELLGEFEFVLTREDTETMKPRPEGLLQAVSMLALPREAVYYVGDSIFDVMAAKEAGVKMVSVTTGNYSAERLRSQGADFVISSIAELARVLGVQPK